MKRMIFLFAMLVVSSAVFAGTPDLDKAVNGYMQALKSDNIGLRYSAIYEIAQLKCLYPEYNYSRVEKVLNQISRKDDQTIIRVHASLVNDYLKSDNVSCVKAADTEDPMMFFDALHHEFNTQMLESTAQLTKS